MHVIGQLFVALFRLIFRIIGGLAIAAGGFFIFAGDLQFAVALILFGIGVISFLLLNTTEGMWVFLKRLYEANDAVNSVSFESKEGR